MRASENVSARAIGVDHRQRFKETLGVLVELDHRLALVVGEQPVQRLALPLALVDRPGLLALLIHREHDAAVQQLLVHVDRRRGQHDRHGADAPVGVGDQPPGCPSLPVEAIRSSPSDCNSLSA